MEEDIVRTVLVRYLQSLGRKPYVKPKHAAGPDVIVEGKAYECKGSSFDKDILFRQLISYAHQYSIIGIAVPWDALDHSLIYRLSALELLIKEIKGLAGRIEVCVVTEENNRYFLCCRDYVTRLFQDIVSEIPRKFAPQYAELSPRERELKILEEFLKNLDDRIKEYARDIAIKQEKCEFSYTLTLNEV